MQVAIASDHAGFQLKERLTSAVADAGHAVTDLGTHSDDPVDYPDYAAAVAKTVVSGKAERGIIVCGSGAGASIAANKVRGIRCTLSHDNYTAHQSVEHDDANLLALGSRVVGELLAEEIVLSFLSAHFGGEERHIRRLQKVEDLERQFAGEA